MTALIVAIFVASLLGSLHCVGMCGAFVALVAGDTPSKRPTFAYHAGRLISYAALGAAAGAVGGLIDLAGTLAGIQPMAAALAGATMVAFGIVALLRIMGVRIDHLRLPQNWTRLVSRASASAMKRPPIVRAAIIGLCTTLLPCGWLYAFAITAAGTGHALSGALAMTVFWLGTLPALLLVGASVKRLLGPLALKAPAIVAMLLITVGLYTLINRTLMNPLAMAQHARSRLQPTTVPADCCTTNE